METRIPPSSVDDVKITPVYDHKRTGSWQSDETFVGNEDTTSLLDKAKISPETTDVFPVDYTSLAEKRRKRRRQLVCMGLGALVIGILGLLLTLDIMLRFSQAWLSAPDYTDQDDPALRQWGANGTGTEESAWYPTDFLQDVIPLPIHSHNDYLRKAPLFTAIRQGCTGVEADVWLFDDLPDKETLFVGHTPPSLQPGRTFESLYVQPLVKILEHQNPRTEFYNGNWRGVFDANPNQTLALLVDVKTSGSSTWAKVLQQLEPLRQRDWLSYYSDGQVHTRPITVVGTGNTPFEDIVANTTYRDYFFDAPLSKLTTTSPSSLLPDYDATNSYYASVSVTRAIGVPWFGNFGTEQIERIRDQVRAAHARGLKARYWDLPTWPVAARNHIWDLLVKEGVDMLNVDDVRSAAKMNWES